MESITVQATYTKGVLKPAKKLNLPEGAKVEVKITSVPPASALSQVTFASLAGIWGHLSEAEVDRLEKAVEKSRKKSAYKIERLGHQLGEDTDE